MFCINCHASSTKVTNSRAHIKQPQIWRRRHCDECGRTFTTHERPRLEYNKKVHYLDTGASKLFSRGRLIVSLVASFSHDSEKGLDSAEHLAATIEASLLSHLRDSTKTELTSQIIAQVAYSTLKNFDEIAAIQYAAKHNLLKKRKNL